MGALAVPMMIGAGVGGGINLLRGKGLGGILQGAALGGAGGALTGGIGSAFGGGATGGATGGVASGTAGALPGTVENMGLVFNPATGTYLAPETYLGASSAFPVFTGGEGVLSNAMGNIGASIPQSVKDYATPQNLLGVAQLATQDTKAPSMALGGGASVRGGQAPQYQGFPLATTTSWQKKVGY